MKPWLFTQGKQIHGIECTYDEFRLSVSSALGSIAKSDDIYIVGSAAFGFSTNPTKETLLNPFGLESDLDVIVISHEIFLQTWDTLRKAYYAGYRFIAQKYGPTVFRGFIYEPDRHFQTTLLRKQIKDTKEMKRRVQELTGITIPVRYRIYRDFESALIYHTDGFEKCQKKTKK